jgi:hypothetical protein
MTLHYAPLKLKTSVWQKTKTWYHLQIVFTPKNFEQAELLTAFLTTDN